VAETRLALESDVQESQWRLGGRNLLQIAWQRKSIVLLCVVVALILAGVYFAQAKRVYQSTSQILVVKKTPDTSLTGVDARHGSYEDYVATHQTLIKSPRIVDYALSDKDMVKKWGLKAEFEKLNTGKDEDDQLVNIIAALGVARDRSAVGAIGHNNVMKLSFDSTNPELSQKMLNAVIESYQLYLAATYQDVSQQAANFIKEAGVTLTKDIGETTKQWEAFQQNAPLVTVRGKQGDSALQENFSNIMMKRSAVLIRMASVKTHLDVLQKGIEEKRDPKELLRELAGAPPDRAEGERFGRAPQGNVQELLQVLLQKDHELQENRGRLHPEMVAHRKKIELARSFLLSPTALWNGGDAEPAHPAGSPLDSVQEVRAHYEQKLKDLKIEEANLSELLKKEHEDARALINYEFKDTRFRESLELKKKQHDSILKRLDEISLIKNMGGYTADPIAPPKLGKKISPRGIIVFPLGLLVGLVAGFGLAYLADMTDQSFRSPEEIRRTLNLPLIGQIPALKAHEMTVVPDDPRIAALDPMLLSFFSPLCPESEAYRGVRTALYFSGLSGHKVIQVTSPNSGDGKSTLIANLAISIAQSSKRVLLIDADMRKPRSHTIFGLTGPLGLGSIMMDNHDPKEAIQETCIEGLSLMPCGPIPPNPAELLTSPRFKDLLDYLREQFDFVLIDTPPLLMVTDPTIVAARVDGVILTVRLTRDTRSQATRARDILAGMGAKTLGVVVNDVKEHAGSYGYGSGYGYGYGYGQGNGDGYHKPEVTYNRIASEKTTDTAVAPALPVSANGDHKGA
jgi:polysaccharide biosynthesis transport protein